MGEYTEAENRQDVDDLHNLRKSWFIYVHDKSKQTALHQPRSLITSCESILKELLEGLPVEIDEEMLSILAQYGATMFSWGQQAITHGINSANLVPCKCISISDDDLKRFFEN
jgi:hypothetical protein